ncbi:MAG: hypothetical protein AB1689_03500, partial [Thermodesulfobacteriota bacterium]
ACARETSGPAQRRPPDAVTCRLDDAACWRLRIAHETAHERGPPENEATIAVIVHSDKGPTSGFPFGATYLEDLYMTLVNAYFGTKPAVAAATQAPAARTPAPRRGRRLASGRATP